MGLHYNVLGDFCNIGKLKKQILGESETWCDCNHPNL